MNTKDEPSHLLVGQVLKRPLYHPLTGKMLVASGTVLSPTLFERIQRLSLLEVAIKCLAPRQSLRATPIPTYREACTTEIRQQAHRLEELLLQGLSLEGAVSHEYLGPAMSTVEALLLRLQQADLKPGCDLRIYGGGELTHPINVLVLSALMGIQLRLPWKKLVALGQAALLHDLGKHHVNLQRLGGRMSDYARRAMERHPEHGVEAVKQLKHFVPQIQEDVLLGIQAHHERWDGTGYPLGWKGEVIPLIARILTVAGRYELLTADQFDMPRMLSGDAYREIRALADRAYDPRVIAAFSQVVTPYPDQAILRLGNGQVCRVLRQGRDPLHPIVRLGEGERELDLGQAGGLAIER